MRALVGDHATDVTSDECPDSTCETTQASSDPSLGAAPPSDRFHTNTYLSGCQPSDLGDTVVICKDYHPILKQYGHPWQI